MAWRSQKERDTILYWYAQASSLGLEELSQLHPELQDFILKVRSIAHWEQETPPTYTNDQVKDQVLRIIAENPRWLAPLRISHDLQHLTINEFWLYWQVNKHLCDAIDLLHELDIHEAQISAEYNNEAEVLAHTLSIRLGLLTSTLTLRNIYPAGASEQLALDARIKALNEAGIGTDFQERD